MAVSLLYLIWNAVIRDMACGNTIYGRYRNEEICRRWFPYYRQRITACQADYRWPPTSLCFLYYGLILSENRNKSSLPERFFWIW